MRHNESHGERVLHRCLLLQSFYFYPKCEEVREGIRKGGRSNSRDEGQGGWNVCPLFLRVFIYLLSDIEKPTGVVIINDDIVFFYFVILRTRPHRTTLNTVETSVEETKPCR